MASWGRHGWPRSNEDMRLYRERNGTFLLVFVDREALPYGGWPALANVYEGLSPSPVSCTIAPDYIYKKGCSRVQWSELTEEYKDAFLRMIDSKPEDVRGFWLINPKR